MNIKTLIAELPITVYRGEKATLITGLCSHSKRVAPGDLFIAKQGSIQDGAHYIEDAIASGAAAILTDFPNPFLKGVVQLITEDISAVEGELAARFFGRPSRELFTIGVTGTNGKTTTTYLVKHLLDCLKIPCGLIGTIEYIVGEHRFAADRTTPDVLTNCKLLKEMLKRGCQAAALEVSSHGLDQGRVAPIEFDVGIFTNLTQDHLDYHETMESYAAAKQRLFGQSKNAVINFDSAWCPTPSGPVITYGLKEGADLVAHSIRLTTKGASFVVSYKGVEMPISWDLIGRFNISNALAAIAALLFKGFALEEIAPHLATLPRIPGRLERVENLNVFVDYAHTPDALEKALQAIREISRGRVLALFGCGGNRDRTKRILMGKVADTRSDFTYITSDNPRGEDPLSICHEIAGGFASRAYTIVPDRMQAISMALHEMKDDDCLLIAGKGHEGYQVLRHQTLPFDDKQTVQELKARATR